MENGTHRIIPGGLTDMVAIAVCFVNTRTKCFFISPREVDPTKYLLLLILLFIGLTPPRQFGLFSPLLEIDFLILETPKCLIRIFSFVESAIN